MKPALITLLTFFLAASSLRSAQEQLPNRSPSGPLTPDQALSTFQLEPNLQITTAAAEPLVVDPVAIAFDAEGRLYVAENRGYPTGPGEGRPPEGRIALLEDQDNDGVYDQRTDFAHDLTFPNGVLPWKGGVFVTCAPDLLYLKDTDGDNQADTREVVFTGFSTQRSTQLRVGYPTLALDNWIYLASGLSGGEITSPRYPDRSPVDIARTDFRFQPGTDRFEPVDGKAQFGLAFDRFGRRFLCMNRVHIQHVVLPSSFLERNPFLPFSETVEKLPESMHPDLLKGRGAAARIYPISDNITTADSHAGTFTAACGLLIYHGIGLPQAYQGNAMACDPTGNLVHRDRLIPNGATFVARRARGQTEMLASTDNWFRPVYLADGPDGALYICDMYRKTIEHPQYLPDEIRKRTDFASGKGMGRIYRVTGKDQQPRPTENLTNASVKELASQLGNPNAWQRRTAHRLLLERGDPSTAAALNSLLEQKGATTPEFRLHAFYLLKGLIQLEDRHVNAALKDAHPAVREHAIQWVIQRLQHGDSPSRWIEPLLNSAADSAPRVRFYCALALGEIPQPHVLPALARIALQDRSDRWARAAVLSSIGHRSVAFLDDLLPLLGPDAENNAGLLNLMDQLGQILGAGLPDDRRQDVIQRFMRPDQNAVEPWQFAALNGFTDGISGRRVRLTDSITEKRLSQTLTRFIRQAKGLALDESRPLDIRESAVEFLDQGEYQEVNAALLTLLDPHRPAELQRAAVVALGKMQDAKVASALLERSRWQTYTPTLRKAVLSTLLSYSQHLPGLLSAVDSGTISPFALTPDQRKRVLTHSDDAIRNKAAELFDNLESGDRMEIYRDYRSVVERQADPAHGQEVFQEHCASCHRLDRQGYPVGPDLFGIRNQSKETILLHILVPEYEIVPGYEGYLIETEDGRLINGLITSETPASITLRQPLAEETTVLRDQINSLQANRLSLMPQELEKNMSRQDMADLLAYLKGE